MNDETTLIKWFKTEQEVKNDPDIEIPIKNEEIEAARDETGGKVPEDRLRVIVRNRKIAECAKVLLKEQDVLSKSDFNAVSTRFLSTAIEECLESDEILLNILALVDRRIGKKRLLHMAEGIKVKHPIVQFFYKIRVSTL